MNILSNEESIEIVWTTLLYQCYKEFIYFHNRQIYKCILYSVLLVLRMYFSLNTFHKSILLKIIVIVCVIISLCDWSFSLQNK